MLVAGMEICGYICVEMVAPPCGDKDAGHERAAVRIDVRAGSEKGMG